MVTFKFDDAGTLCCEVHGRGDDCLSSMFLE